MAKSPKPIKLLDAKQALRAIKNYDKNNFFLAVMNGITSHFLPNLAMHEDESKLGGHENFVTNADYVANLYAAGGYLEIITHFQDGEKLIYLDRNELQKNPEFVALLNSWNRADLCACIRNHQRITKKLRQSVATKNFSRLAEVFALLEPANIRLRALQKQHGVGGKVGSERRIKESKSRSDGLADRIQGMAEALLVTFDKRQIAGIIANKLNSESDQKVWTADSIRYYLNKNKTKIK